MLVHFDAAEFVSGHIALKQTNRYGVKETVAILKADEKGLSALKTALDAFDLQHSNLTSSRI
jgi:hypothetical protein